MSAVCQANSLALTPDLRTLQLDSFCHFIFCLLPMACRHVQACGNPTDNLTWYAIGEDYRLEATITSPVAALTYGTTYACRLYLPICVVHHDEGSHELHTVCLGSIPIMTRDGTFIINGIARCMVSQLLRSPGVYYTLNSEGIYICTIISDTGKRLKIRFGSKRVTVIFHNKARLHVCTVLIALGVNFYRIPHRVKVRNETEYKKPREFSEAKALLMTTLAPTHSLLREELWDPTQVLQDYTLGPIGRFNFNRRLNRSGMTQGPEFGVHDLYLATVHLADVATGQAALDDIDDLKYKRVKRVGDVMHEHMVHGLYSLRKKLDHTLTKRTHHPKTLAPGTLILAQILSLDRLFASYELSQYLDQTNPLADLVHKRKVSASGPGGLTPRTARFRVRDIHPSQYGRICAIETAEGEKAGLVTAFTITAGVDADGHLNNLLYALHSLQMAGQVVRALPHDDEYYAVATGRSLEIVLTATQNRRQFINLAWQDVTHRNLFPLHLFAVGIGLIPFLEHDDSTRALMGSNMQRQAVPLVKPAQPIVGTGLEACVGLDSPQLWVTTQPTYIDYVDAYRVRWCNLITGSTMTMPLLAYARLNNNILTHQRVLVKRGQYLQAGQIVADTNATQGGELALGQNVLVAYMPWDGYNFEDAILISDRLVQAQVYTSLSIKKYEVELRTNFDVEECLTRDIPQLSPYFLRHLNDQGLVRIGHAVEAGDVLVGKLTRSSNADSLYGAEARLLQEIFGVNNVTMQETCLKVPRRGEGRVIDVRVVSSESFILGTVQTISVYILQHRPIQIGDKLAGRHGNKGVVSCIVPHSVMPHLTDGTPVDMVLSPLGVPSRMNVGQILECVLGFSGKILGKQYRVLPFDERYEPQASRKLVLSELYAAGRDKPWAWDVQTPGKIRLVDGRTEQHFEQTITVGYAYMLKLIHQVQDKIHARATGPYAIITQQPLRGKARRGGQRVGEMEVWAFQGFGAAYTLQELLSVKADHLDGRTTAVKTLIHGQSVPILHSASDCLRTFVRELWSLGLDLRQFQVSVSGTEREITL